MTTERREKTAWRRLLEDIRELDPLSTRTELLTMDEDDFRRSWVMLVIDLWTSGDCSAGDLCRVLNTVRTRYERVVMTRGQRMDEATKWLTRYMLDTDRGTGVGVQSIKDKAKAEGLLWSDIKAVRASVGVTEGHRKTTKVWRRAAKVRGQAAA